MLRKKLPLLVVAALTTVGLAACSGGDTPSAESSSNGGHSVTPSTQPTGGDSTTIPGTVDDDKTVATVNGQKIKGLRYNAVLSQVHRNAQQGQGGAPSEKQEKKQAIDAVVGNELLVQTSKKHGYKASKSDVDEQLEKTKSRFKSEKKFKQALKQQDITIDLLRKQLARHIEIEEYINSEIGPFKVSDKRIEQYYKKLKAQQKQHGGANENSLPPLKKIKPQIKKQLQQQQEAQKVSSEIQKLKKKADVKILI